MRRAEMATGSEPTTHGSYPDAHDAIRTMVVRGGIGNAALCEAYFNGDLGPLRTAMNAGAGNENRYELWKGYMNRAAPLYSDANALFP
jgi:hypothetical protein